ncbi:hypothetical protein ACQJBY_069113 [Aegilops geniculata]
MLPRPFVRYAPPLSSLLPATKIGHPSPRTCQVIQCVATCQRYPSTARFLSLRPRRHRSFIGVLHRRCVAAVLRPVDELLLRDTSASVPSTRDVLFLCRPLICCFLMSCLAAFSMAAAAAAHAVGGHYRLYSSCIDIHALAVLPRVPPHSVIEAGTVM